MGNFTYVPAEVPGACSMNKNIFWFDKGHKQELGWWKPTSIFKYPRILISAHYGQDWPQLRNDLEFPDDGLIIGDSGGFQLMSLKEWSKKDIHIDPVKVFEWQKNNCNIGFPLDYPPFEDSEEAFNKSISISDKNFQIAEDLYEIYLQDCLREEQTPMKLYNVLQGYGFDKRKLDRWYTMASKYKNMTNTGWAFGLKPWATPINIAYQAMYMFEKGFKENFHFFAVSGSKTIPVMCYLARYIDNITSDSSGWAQGAMQRKYFMPGYFGKYELFFGTNNAAEINTLPCKCPICEKVGKNVSLLSSQGSAPGGIISLHNLYQLIQFSTLCNSLKDDQQIFKEFVKKMFDSEVITAIEFIDYSLEKGFENACIKFQKHFYKTSGKPETTGLLNY
jgi:hypothetical protein